MSSFQETGANSNWKTGKFPRNFVGFAIEFREPGGDKFWAIRNRIGFKEFA